MADWEWRNEEEQEKGQKEKKYVTRREFYLCFFLLLAVLVLAVFFIGARIQRMGDAISDTVYRVEERFNNRIDSIPRNIEKGVENANHPIYESEMEIVDFDMKAKTAVIRITAVPKEYQEGMEVCFFAECDEAETIEAVAEADEDRTFVAEMLIPLCELAEVRAVLYRNGTEWIQEIGALSIRENVLPRIHAYFPNKSFIHGEDFNRITGEVEVEFTPTSWMWEKGDTTLKNVRTEVFVDETLVQTIPMAETEEGHGEDAVRYTGRMEEFTLRKGETAVYYFKAEDGSGNEYAFLIEMGRLGKDNNYDEVELHEEIGRYKERLTIE